MKKKSLFKILTTVCASTLLIGQALAEQFPNHPIRLITPFQAGNVLDAAARDVAEKFHQNTGKTMIVENKPGGDGVIAAQTVMNAKDKGHSLLISTTSILGINPYVFDKLSYDPMADFKHVSNMIGMTMVIAIQADNPSNTLEEFIDWVKNNPAGTTYASFVSSSQYLGALLNEKAGIDMLNVPFNGTPVVVQNLLGGHVDAAILPLASIKSLTDAKRIKVLAVSSPERSELLPDVPTFREKNYDELTTYIWAGISAPANTPETQINWLNAEFTKILSDPVLKEKWSTLDMTPLPSTSQAFTDYIQKDQKMWANAIQASAFQGKK